MVETSEPIPDLKLNNNIVEMVTKATIAQVLKFRSAQGSVNGNIRFQTNPSTSAAEGAKYHVEITFAFDALLIQATYIYANSQ